MLSKGTTIRHCAQLRNCDTSLHAIKEPRYVTACNKETAIRHCAQLRNCDTSLHAIKKPRYVTVRPKEQHDCTAHYSLRLPLPIKQRDRSSPPPPHLHVTATYNSQPAQQIIVWRRSKLSTRKNNSPLTRRVFSTPPKTLLVPSCSKTCM